MATRCKRAPERHPVNTVHVRGLVSVERSNRGGASLSTEGGMAHVLELLLNGHDLSIWSLPDHRDERDRASSSIQNLIAESIRELIMFLWTLPIFF